MTTQDPTELCDAECAAMCDVLAWDAEYDWPGGLSEAGWRVFTSPDAKWSPITLAEARRLM